MKADTVLANLASFGLNMADQDKELVDSFLLEMEKVNYGKEETLDAFQWYALGFRDGMRSYGRGLGIRRG